MQFDESGGVQGHKGEVIEVEEELDGELPELVEGDEADAEKEVEPRQSGGQQKTNFDLDFVYLTQKIVEIDSFDSFYPLQAALLINPKARQN